MKELQYLNKYFLKYKFRFLFGILITIVAQIIKLFVPEYIGDSIALVQKFIENSQTNTSELFSAILEKFIWVLVVTIVAGFFTFLMRQTLIVMSRYVEFDLKNEIFNHYQSKFTERPGFNIKTV